MDNRLVGRAIPLDGGGTTVPMVEPELPGMLSRVEARVEAVDSLTAQLAKVLEPVLSNVPRASDSPGKLEKAAISPVGERLHSFYFRLGEVCDRLNGLMERLQV